MIDLLKEARRRAPSEDKPSIKLANPDVFSELERLYHRSNDTIFRTVVKELFHLVGGSWPDRLIQPEAAPVTYSSRVYRGTTTLTERPAPDGGISAQTSEKTKPKRIYRGRIVA